MTSTWLPLVTLAVTLTSVTLGQRVPFTADMKAAVIAHHDQIRQETGHAMPGLKWDEKLASLAADAARNCQFRHYNWAKGYGENLAFKGGALYKNMTPKERAVDASKAWYSEVASFRRAGWRCMKMGGKANCNHYAQQVWPKTTHIGCAMHACPRLRFFVYCVYNPQGNMGTPW